MSDEAPKRTRVLFVLAVRLELARAPNWPGALAPVVREATPPACTLNLHINTYMLRFGCVEAVGGQGGTVAGMGIALDWDVLGVLTTGSVDAALSPTPQLQCLRGNTHCIHAQPAHKYIDVMIPARGGRGRAGRHRGGQWGGLTLGCVGHPAHPKPSAHAKRTQTRQAGLINSWYKGVQPPGFNSQHMHTHHERGGILKNTFKKKTTVHDRRCSTQRTETHKVPLKMKHASCCGANRRYHGQGSEEPARAIGTRGDAVCVRERGLVLLQLVHYNTQPHPTPRVYHPGRRGCHREPERGVKPKVIRSASPYFPGR